MTDDNLGSDIDVLPDDLLVHIWSIVDDEPSGPETPYIIAAVSHRWRELALNTAHLWSKLTAVRGHGAVTNDLKIRLERSKKAPLYVRFHRTSLEALVVLGSKLDQWENIFIGPECYNDVLNYLTSRKGLPRSSTLKEVTLSLTFGCRRWDISAGYHIWPQLKTFNITCSSIADWISLFPPGLTSISVITTNLTGAAFRRLIEACPNIRTMYLAVNDFKSSISEEESRPSLSSFQELTFGEAVPLEVIQMLSDCAPNFHSLVWRPRSPGSSFLPSKSTRTTGITHFTVDMSYSGPARSSKDLFRPLLTVLPKLHTLTLTRKIKQLSGTDEEPSAAMAELTEWKLYIMRRLVNDILTCLGSYDAGGKLCPVLSVVEMESVSFDKDLLLPVATKLAKGSREGKSDTRPRMKFLGLMEVEEKDLEEIGRVVSVQID